MVLAFVSIQNEQTFLWKAYTFKLTQTLTKEGNINKEKRYKDNEQLTKETFILKSLIHKDSLTCIFFQDHRKGTP